MLFPAKKLYFCTAFFLLFFIFQIYFLYSLNSSENYSTSNSGKIFEIYKNISYRLNVEENTDSAALYKVLSIKEFANNVTGMDITLVSQCSFNHLHLIENLSHVWTGPISIAVFIERGYVEKTIWNLAKILYCNLKKNLYIHLVIPIEDSYVKDYNYGLSIMHNVNHSNYCNFSSHTSKLQNYKRSVPYPINLLRNVAKRHCLTDYIMIIDIDMTPSLNLRENFLNFVLLKKAEDHAVFVVPAFEIDVNISVPSNKTELIREIRGKKCRPFYFVPCRKCHKATAYNKWLIMNDYSGTKILYEIKWKHPWEPFFISKSNVPDYDERFKQYGMNRISQICELHVAGYRFYVLDNAFLVHRGFKTVDGFHETKNAEMETNRKVYAQFKHELRFKYPNSKETC